MRKYIRILLIFFISVIYCVNEASAQNDRQLIQQGNRLYHQEKYDKAEVEYRKNGFKNPKIQAFIIWDVLFDATKGFLLLLFSIKMRVRWRQIKYARLKCIIISVSYVRSTRCLVMQ